MKSVKKPDFGTVKVTGSQTKFICMNQWALKGFKHRVQKV